MYLIFCFKKMKISNVSFVWDIVNGIEWFFVKSKWVWIANLLSIIFRQVYILIALIYNLKHESHVILIIYRGIWKTSHTIQLIQPFNYKSIYKRGSKNLMNPIYLHPTPNCNVHITCRVLCQKLIVRPQSPI